MMNEPLMCAICKWTVGHAAGCPGYKDPRDGQIADWQARALAAEAEVAECRAWAQKALQAFEDARTGHMRGDWAVTDIESAAKQILARTTPAGLVYAPDDGGDGRPFLDPIIRREE